MIGRRLRTFTWRNSVGTGEAGVFRMGELQHTYVLHCFAMKHQHFGLGTRKWTGVFGWELRAKSESGGRTQNEQLCFCLGRELV